MADEVTAHPSSSMRGMPATQRSGATAEERLAANLPRHERNQPDPAMQLNVGRVGAGSITLVAVVCAIIIGVVLWGLNSPAPNARNVSPAASASTNPPGPGSSGAGTPNQPSNNTNAGKG